MYLCNTCAGSCCPLHDTLGLISIEADTKNLLDLFSELFPNNLTYILPAVLRCIIEHARKHLLEFRWQNSTLHGNSLTDLEIQSSIVSQQMEQLLRATVMYVGD